MAGAVKCSQERLRQSKNTKSFLMSLGAEEKVCQKMSESGYPRNFARYRQIWRSIQHGLGRNLRMSIKVSRCSCNKYAELQEGRCERHGWNRPSKKTRR